jgi:peptidoglycan/xylan/chitin deacetylase (PgdA/CDA1 family)
MRCRVEGVPRVALSFDDGPSGTHTPLILDQLARLGARATFFLLGVHARRHAGIARRTANDGHEIGLHGHHHLPPALLPWPLVEREIETGRRIVREATGATPRFYRAPFGLLRPGQAARLRSLGLEPVLGDVYPDDHARPGADRIATDALARLRPGSILILHDASAVRDFDRRQTAAALATIVPGLRARGLAVGTIGELVSAARG